MSLTKAGLKSFLYMAAIYRITPKRQIKNSTLLDARLITFHEDVMRVTKVRMFIRIIAFSLKSVEKEDMCG